MYALQSKHAAQDSDDDGRDIQVVTDIRVQVNDGETNTGGWRGGSDKDWAVVSSTKETDRASSTDTLVKVPTRGP